MNININNNTLNIDDVVITKTILGGLISEGGIINLGLFAIIPGTIGDRFNDAPMNVIRYISDYQNDIFPYIVLFDNDVMFEFFDIIMVLHLNDTGVKVLITLNVYDASPEVISNKDTDDNNSTKYEFDLTCLLYDITDENILYSNALRLFVIETIDDIIKSYREDNSVEDLFYRSVKIALINEF